MPAPVINTTLLKNAFAVGEQLAIQLGATNTPTSWSIGNSDTLPAGLFLDTTNGTFFGKVSSAGIYTLNVKAINADGTSAEAPIVLGFYDIRCDLHLRKATINLDTLAVTLLNPIGTGTTAVSGFAKYGDDLNWSILLTSSSATTCPPRVNMATFAIKNSDGVKYLETSETAFGQTTIFDGTTNLKYYTIASALESELLLTELENTSDDYIDVNAEFELEIDSNSGTYSAKTSSATFVFRVYKQIVGLEE